ncbi:MAG: hypothetical protein ACTSUB_10480 [Candidatus Thorarchaeota archaeon]
MQSRNDKLVTIVAILGYLAISLRLFLDLDLTSYDASEIVPLTGLPSTLHIILIVIIWPIIGCILLVPIIPRITVPLFSRITKRGSDYHHDGYIELETEQLGFRKVVSRAFFTFLLVMGLESTVIPLFELQYFMSTVNYDEWIATPFVPLHLHPMIFIITAALLLPIAISIFASVWSLEDSGLVQYHLPSEVTEYQEVRPMYRKLSAYLKGYAGISALFYYISSILEMIEFGTEAETFIWVPFISVIVFVWALSGIVIHSRLNLDWVRKGRTKLERVENISG